MPQFQNKADHTALPNALGMDELNITLFDALTSIDTSAISLLDSLASPHAPDTNLIQGMPARDLNSATTALVRGLQDIDIERVNRPFNWWERATGKDLEQRIRFDLATHEVSGLMTDMVKAHVHAEAARDAILRDAHHLEEVNARLPALIDAASRCLARLPGEPFHVERFKKRIADLETLVTANRMLEAQYGVSYQMLVSLLDRTDEVIRVLLPLWQQHAFAIANAGVGDKTEKSVMTAFGLIQKKIYARLFVNEEVAA